jgi:hypothetical protein
MLSPNEVTAVIVTRGDVDLQPVLDSLIFDEVIVYDNSRLPDLKTYGRVAAAASASNTAIYSQDDDILHSPKQQRQILNAYEPGVLTGCMWREWSDGARRQGIENGYDDLVFPGSGSISDFWVWESALARYTTNWMPDDFLHLWSDTIIGVISPTKQLDIRFEELDWGNNDNRMAHMDDAVVLKTEAIRRAREVRDAG